MQIGGGHYTQLLEGRSDLSVSLQVLTGLTARKNPLPQNSKLMECSEGGLGVKKNYPNLEEASNSGTKTVLNLFRAVYF